MFDAGTTCSSAPVFQNYPIKQSWTGIIRTPHLRILRPHSSTPDSWQLSNPENPGSKFTPASKEHGGQNPRNFKTILWDWKVQWSIKWSLDSVKGCGIVRGYLVFTMRVTTLLSIFGAVAALPATSNIARASISKADGTKFNIDGVTKCRLSSFHTAKIIANRSMKTMQERTATGSVF